MFQVEFSDDSSTALAARRKDGLRLDASNSNMVKQDTISAIFRF